MERVIYEKFVEVLGEPVSEEALWCYINECLTLHGKHNGQFDRHHVLPKSKFDDLKRTKWNLVELTRQNHVKVHKLLIRAYKILEFTHPLNFLTDMTDEEYAEYCEARSVAAKAAWNEFAKDKERLEKKSQAVKQFHAENNVPGAEWYENNVKRVIQQYQDYPEIKEKIAESMRQFWANLTDEQRVEISENRRWDEARHELHLQQLERQYNDPEFKKRFIEIMTVVNADPAKREDASIKLKKCWEDPVYVKRTMDSRAKGNAERKALGIKRSNSTKMKEKWQDPVWKAKILADRQAKREREKNEAK